jgi:hypothetical protein
MSKTTKFVARAKQHGYKAKRNDAETAADLILAQATRVDALNPAIVSQTERARALESIWTYYGQVQHLLDAGQASAQQFSSVFDPLTGEIDTGCYASLPKPIDY